MAKKLDPQEIEQSRRKKTRADNREERKERRPPEKCVLQLMSVSAHRKNSK